MFLVDRFNSGRFNEILPSDGRMAVSDGLRIFPKQTIINQSLVEPIMFWLNSKRLHNYEWFFMELSFNEIEEITEDNIEYFISKVNKKSMTKGAQKKICFETKLLRNRKSECEKLILVIH